MEDSGGDLMSSSQMLQLGIKQEAPNDGTTAMDGTELGLRKRAPDGEGCTTLLLSSADDRLHDRITAVKKRILEHKHLRLKSVKEK